MEQPASRVSAGARLMVPSGGLLALCFFLPAVKVCSQPTAPYEAPGVFPPYLFGLLAAVIGALLLGRRIVPPLLRWGAWLVAAGGGAALTVALSAQVIERRGGRRAGTAALAALALALTVALLALLRRRVTAERRLSRTVALGGALSLLWCGLLFSGEELHNLMYGFWLSLAASLGLVIAGLLRPEPPRA